MAISDLGTVTKLGRFTGLLLNSPTSPLLVAFKSRPFWRRREFRLEALKLPLSSSSPRWQH